MTLRDDDIHHFERHDLAEEGRAEDERKPRARGKKRAMRGSSDEAHVTEQLTHIYENADGTMPDMRRIDRRQRHRLLRAALFLAGAVAFLAIVAWVGFFVLQPAATFRETDVMVSVAGPESVRAGDDVRYRIRYRNDGTIPMERTVLQVRYPEGFVFSESSRPSASAANDEWDVGTIDPDESGYIDVKGLMYGTVGKEQSFRVFLNYTPSNFSSEFQKVATTRILVAEAPVEITLSGKKDVISGSEEEITVTVAPADGVALPYLAVEVEPGEFFTKKSATPALSGDSQARWLVDSLSKEETFRVSGLFVGTGESETATVQIVVRGWRDAERSGEGFVYAAATHEVRIAKTAITATLAVNGTTKAMPVAPGDILNVSLVVRNGGSAPVDAVVVRAIFDTPSNARQSILDWRALDDPLDGTVAGEQLNVDTRRGIIIWDSTKIPELKRMGAGEEVVIDFHLPVKDGDDADLTTFKTAIITAAAEVQSGRGKERQIVGTNPIYMTVLSDTAFVVEDEIGETPDGKESHLVSWIIKNTFHELSDIRVEADVYGDAIVVTSTMEVGAGEVAYDPAAKKIIWMIPAMPISVDVLALQFPVVLQSKNPTQTNLTSKAALKATDTVARIEILKAGDEILLQ